MSIREVIGREWVVLSDERASLRSEGVIEWRGGKEIGVTGACVGKSGVVRTQVRFIFCVSCNHLAKRGRLKLPEVGEKWR
jgi:hypothetical protein